MSSVRGQEPVGDPDPRGLRAVEGLAGLLAAGLVVLGAGLLILKIAVPIFDHGTGLAAATGPTWWRALLQLVVGAVAEVVWHLRRRWPVPARIGQAAATTGACVIVLGVCWWI